MQRVQQAQAEAQRYREDNKALQADVVVAKQRIDEIAAQANGKIDSANERIRTLRKERDAAQKEADRLRGAGERLVSRQEECRRERQELAEQKEALLRIVEDLHQTCKAAGMTNAGRHSIKEPPLRSVRAVGRPIHPHTCPHVCAYIHMARAPVCAKRPI
eukprot:g3286.t1